MSQQTAAAPEEMASFFDVRAESYDEHMREEVYEGEQDTFYKRVTSPIAETTASVNILDLGCGTGLELSWIFQKTPNAIITGIDMSAGMLDLLQEKHSQHANQLHLVQGSYVEVPFKENEYDYYTISKIITQCSLTKYSLSE